MTDEMRREMHPCRNWTDKAIHSSVLAALQARTTPGNFANEFAGHLTEAEHEALLAGAILYFDSICGFKREPESEPVSQERNIQLVL